MSLDFEKTSNYTAHSDDYTFTIQQRVRQFQVAITNEDSHAGLLLDYPPKFGTLGSAKTYCESWLADQLHWREQVMV